MKVPRYIVKRGFRGWTLNRWMIYDRANLRGPWGYHRTVEQAERWISINLNQEYLEVD